MGYKLYRFVNEVAQYEFVVILSPGKPMSGGGDG